MDGDACGAGAAGLVVSILHESVGRQLGERHRPSALSSLLGLMFFSLARGRGFPPSRSLIAYGNTIYRNRT